MSAGRDDQTLGNAAFEHQAGGVAIARDEFVAERLGESVSDCAAATMAATMRPAGAAKASATA